MIGTPIAFGLTMVVCFTLFYYYWRIRQLRARLLSVQATAITHDIDFPVEFGIGKNIVETFPTIDACELKCAASEDSQCPICLVEYEEWEVLRQLPFCGHIFHTLCVGTWFEKQTTCPVCRTSMSVLTDSLGEGVEDMLYRDPRSSDAAVAVVEVDNEAPSWIRVNRHLPLPAPPSSPPSQSTTHTCTCSGAATATTTLAKPSTTTAATTTLAKTSTGDLGDAVPRRGTSTDCHVVNIQQRKCTAKPVKTVTSEHSDFQILIFQTSVVASDPIRLDVERFLSAGVSSNKPLETPQLIRSQEKLGQPFVSPGSTSSRCDSIASPSSGDVAPVPEEASFEFQHVLTETGELTFRSL